jgi:hypothetical protein
MARTNTITTSGSPGSGMAIGDPVAGADPFRILYTDASGDLTQDAFATRNATFETELARVRTGTDIRTGFATNEAFEPISTIFGAPAPGTGTYYWDTVTDEFVVDGLFDASALGASDFLKTTVGTDGATYFAQHALGGFGQVFVYEDLAGGKEATLDLFGSGVQLAYDNNYQSGFRATENLVGLLDGAEVFSTDGAGNNALITATEGGRVLLISQGPTHNYGLGMSVNGIVFSNANILEQYIFPSTMPTAVGQVLTAQAPGPDSTNLVWATPAGGSPDLYTESAVQPFASTILAGVNAVIIGGQGHEINTIDGENNGIFMGLSNLITGGIGNDDSVIVGGFSNAIDGGNSSVIVGSSLSTSTNSPFAGIYSSEDSTINASQGSVLLGSTQTVQRGAIIVSGNSTIDGMGINSAIMAATGGGISDSNNSFITATSIPSAIPSRILDSEDSVILSGYAQTIEGSEQSAIIGGNNNLIITSGIGFGGNATLASISSSLTGTSNSAVVAGAASFLGTATTGANSTTNAAAIASTMSGGPATNFRTSALVAHETDTTSFNNWQWSAVVGGNEPTKADNLTRSVILGGVAVDIDGATNSVFAGGDGNSAVNVSGSFVTGIGHTLSSLNRSVVAGIGNRIEGNDLTVFGRSHYKQAGAVGGSANEFILGRFSDIETETSKTAWNSQDRLFTVGIGADNANRENALVIWKTGNLEARKGVAYSSIQMVDDANATVALDSTTVVVENLTAPRTITLPDTQSPLIKIGQEYTIKDYGNASANNITVEVSDTANDEIDGGTTHTISTNYESITVRLISGRRWIII